MIPFVPILLIGAIVGAVAIVAPKEPKYMEIPIFKPNGKQNAKFELKDPSTVVLDHKPSVDLKHRGRSLIFHSNDEESVEAISAYGIARLTIEAFKRQEKILHDYRLIPSVKLSAMTSKIYPHAKKNFKDEVVEGVNGEFSINDGVGEIRLFNSAKHFATTAHEQGHGILHSLNAKYLCHAKLVYRALHESFADLSVIFSRSSFEIKNKKEGFVEVDFLTQDRFILASGWRQRRVDWEEKDPGGDTRRDPYDSTAMRDSRSYVPESMEEHNQSIPLTSLILESMRDTYLFVVNDRELKSTPFGKKPRMVMQYYQRLLMSAVSTAPEFNSLEEFGEILKNTQYKMASECPQIAAFDSFDNKFLKVKREDLCRFHNIAREQFNQWFEHLRANLARVTGMVTRGGLTRAEIEERFGVTDGSTRGSQCRRGLPHAGAGYEVEDRRG